MKKKTRHETDTPIPESAAADVQAGSPAEAAAPALEHPSATEDALPEAAEVQAEAAEVSAEIEALKDRLLRLQADFDNYRKRVTRDWADMCARANEALVLELLPVLDHFEMGLKSAGEHGAPETVMKGFTLVYRQLMDVLARAGVSPIEAEGGPFNAHEHEALAHVPSDTVPPEHVVQVIRRGYRLGHRLLRAAQVLVSSGPPSGADAGSAKSAPADQG